MQYPIIIRAREGDQIEAEPVGIPELKSVARTEQEAIEQVGIALEQWLATGKVIQIDVPGIGTGNPWVDFYGRSADDPDFEAYLAEIKRVRSTHGAVLSCSNPS